MTKIIGIVGLGLIGCSFGLKLQKSKFANKIIGIDTNKEYVKYAIENKIIHEASSLYNLINDASIIILSTPVNVIQKLLPIILNKISNKQIVFDTGSTKYDICKIVSSHINRNRFVATHPMAGIEKSGPYFSDYNLFFNKHCIICDVNLSDIDAVSTVEYIYSNILYTKTIYKISSKNHDLYISYVSHLPNMISFSLANLILKKFKKNKKTLFYGPGLSSVIRLAKSNPNMWTSICYSNRKNLIKSLSDYIENLNKVKSYLINKNFIKIYKYLNKANDIKKI